MRGGRVVFQNIQKPNTDDWTSALDAVESSLELEKSVHESLLALHRNADEQSDAQLTDFLEGEYLKEQVNLKKKILCFKICYDFINTTLNACLILYVLLFDI